MQYLALAPASVRNSPARPVGTGKIMVLDATRKLFEATPGARSLLAQGTVLRCCFDHVAATTRADGARLIRVLALAKDGGQASAVLEGSGAPVEVECFALHGGHADRPRIVMILKPVIEEQHRRISKAEYDFGLTPAETRLLEALFHGCSVPQAADRLGVAPSTARTHLQRVFDKTGVRRQGHLLQLVSSR